MRWRGLVLLVPLLATLSACRAPAHHTGGLELTASFYPLAWVTEQVSGQSVTDLTTPGAEPHDLEPSVTQAVSVASADLVVYERGFQPALDELVTDVAEGTPLDVATVVDLHDADPHFWLDPLLLADVGDAVAGKLSGLDPEHRVEYEAGAASLRHRLERLDAAYADGLAHCERTTVVVSHDAFGYLERYGLTFEPIAGLSPEAEPSPADLARLDRLVRRDGVTTVFSETLASPRLAEVLADEAGVRSGVLDPIEGLTDSSEGSDYLHIMRANLAHLEEANSCRKP